MGPDLSRIARIRSREDLLEAIVYPSASFVRSYEPVMVLTSDGKSFSGAPVTQTSDSLTLQLNATDQKTIRLDEIVETTAATVSIMPAGLDQQLSSQEFADLLEFLMSRK